MERLDNQKENLASLENKALECETRIVDIQ